MAAAAATSKAKGGMMGLIGPLLVLTLLAGGGGVLVGHLIAGNHPAAAPARNTPAATSEPLDVKSVAVRELSPIIANLAAPEGARLRLQTAIVFDKSDAPQMDLLVPRIAEDTLAFIRTLGIEQLQGASGLEHLRDDLNERAAVRSDGKIKELVIETMVIQ